MSIVPMRPKPQVCGINGCTVMFAGIVCPLCKEERPAYTALKKASAQASAATECRYFPHSICGCGGRGVCLPAA